MKGREGCEGGDEGARVKRRRRRFVFITANTCIRCISRQESGNPLKPKTRPSAEWPHL